MYKKKLEFITLLGELLCFYLALFITLYIRFGQETFLEQTSKHIIPFSIIFLVWLMISYASDLHNLDVFKMYPQRSTVVLIMYFGVSMLFFYIFPEFGISPKTNLIIPVIFSAILSYIWKTLFRRFLQRVSIFRPLIFIAKQKFTFDLIKKVYENRHMGFSVSAVFCEKKDIPAWMHNSSIVMLYSTNELIEYCRTNIVYAVTIEEANYRQYKMLYALLAMHLHLYHISTLWEEIMESIPAPTMKEYLSIHHLGQTIYSSTYSAIKRSFDVFFALILLPLVLPIACVIIIAIVTTSKGPAIYRQVRLGRYGEPFYIYKFRSMSITAEEEGPQWSPVQDTRITPFGAFLRKSHLDELPQLINILIGDMSFIGPRPERPEFITELIKAIPYFSLRNIVRPGLSGWAQVLMPYGASVEEMAEKLSYDFYYIKNFSLILDIRIFLKTMLHLFKRAGR